MFLPGDQLKADLASLNRHYSAMAPEELEKGIFKFATHPPLDDSFPTTRLWDRFFPGWRDIMMRNSNPPTETHEELLAKLRQMDDAQPDESGDRLDPDSAHFMRISRSAPIKKGRYRLIPREAEEAGNKAS
jgi:hypothetical protein